jgi:GMP synthase (glutamine-hydrolysing)
LEETLRKLLIIEVGNTHAHIASRHGDFVDWFIAGLGVDAENRAVIDPRAGDDFLPDGQVCGVVVTGSHAMVTERQPWSERTAGWLAGAVSRGVPVLGICYGHQLLAHALGGEVTDNPRGWEYGTVDVFLNEAGQRDALTGGLGASVRAQMGHVQTVVKLPPGAARLASTHLDANAAFVVNGSAWGLQFHPEISQAVIREYITHNREALTAAGQDPDALAAGCEETPAAARLLARFARIAAESQG